MQNFHSRDLVYKFSLYFCGCILPKGRKNADGAEHCTLECVTMSDMEELFTIYKAFEGGGTIYLMSGLDKSKPDFKTLLTLATLFAREGHQVKILTDCHFKSSEYQMVFGQLNGTKYERKCPDMLIDEKYF